MQDLLNQLKQATVEYKAAESEESRARSAACVARNKLNDVQKKIDAAMILLRKESPIDSDWRRMKPDGSPL